MEYEEIHFVNGIKAYPGAEAAPYELPQGVEWDAEQGVGVAFGHPYNPESGWCMGDDGYYYDVYTGFAYIAAENALCDMSTGYRFDVTTRAPLDVAGYKAYCEANGIDYPYMPQAPAELPATLVWDEAAGVARFPGLDNAAYDAASGWLIDAATGTYYEINYGWRYDAATGNLVDDKTGDVYDMSYNKLS